MFDMSKLEGYEPLHYEESHYGDGRVCGIAILVKVNRKTTEADKTAAWNAAYDFKREIETNTFKNDPAGPAQRAAYRAEIEDIYRKAEVPAIYMEELPNGYCNQPCCLNKPWFRVTSHIGHIEIGWRKRVISIDWKGTRIKQSGQELFPDDNVTRWEHGIHAWSHEAAIKYLKKLHEVR